MRATLALLSPRDFSSQGGTSTELDVARSLSLLITGRIGEYQSLRQRAGGDLPNLSESDSDVDESDPRTALSTAWQIPYLAVSTRTALALRQAAEDYTLDPDLRCAATLLASLSYAQLDDERSASQLCLTNAQHLSESEPTFGLVLSLQASLRLASLGEFERAIEACEAADAFLQESLATADQYESARGVLSKTLEGLTLTVRQNSLTIKSRAGNYLTKGGVDPALEKSTFWTEKDAWAYDAGVDYLTENFDLQVRDPAVMSRPFTIGGQDKVFRRYSVHHVLCELAGHWTRSRDSAALVARERMVRDPKDSASTASALALFRRYDHQKPLLSAVRLIRGQGPLAALAPEVRRAVTTLSNERVSRTALTILRGGAELLSPVEVDDAASSLVDKLPVVSQTDAVGWYRTTDHVIRALAQLAPLSGESDEWLSKLLRLLGDLEDDASAIQQMSRVMSDFNWTTVNEELVDEWRRWSTAHLDGDAQYLAGSVLFRQAKAGYTQASEVLASRFSSSPTLELAATLLDLRSDLPSTVLSAVAPQIETLCINSLQQMMDEAEKGSFGFGGADTALIAAVTANEFESEALWAKLADFLAHPLTAVPHTSRAFDWLSDNIAKVPVWVVDTAAQGALARKSTFQHPFEGDHDRSAAAYRFACAAGGHSAERAFVELLERSTSSTVRDRVEAATSVRFVARLASADLVGPVALRLAADEAIVVRSSVLKSLVTMALDLDGVLRGLFYRSIEGSLRSEGLAELGSALTALEGEVEAGNSEVTRNLLTPLTELARTHESFVVRQRTQTLIGLVEG